MRHLDDMQPVTRGELNKFAQEVAEQLVAIQSVLQTLCSVTGTMTANHKTLIERSRAALAQAAAKREEDNTMI